MRGAPTRKRRRPGEDVGVDKRAHATRAGGEGGQPRTGDGRAHRDCGALPNVRNTYKKEAITTAIDVKRTTSDVTQEEFSAADRPHCVYTYCSIMYEGN